MMEQGLLEEAKGLYDRIENKRLPAMQSIGYAQLFEYFRGNSSLEAAVEKIKLDTRHLAKRQLTWFRREDAIRWFDCNRWPEILAEIERYCVDNL